MRSIALSIALCAVQLAACGRPKSALEAELQDLPPWALGKCEESLKHKDVLCASGSVQGISSVSLARAAAEGRARAELARILQVRVKSMLEDYQSARQGGISAQYVTDTSRQITDVTLSGSKVEQTFVTKTGTFWALVVLDAPAFKESLQQVNELDSQVRAAMSERAERSFGQTQP